MLSGASSSWSRWSGSASASASRWSGPTTSGPEPAGICGENPALTQASLPRLRPMEASSQPVESPATSAFLEAVAQVTATVEAGAGLPEVARSISRALGASVVVVDASGSILAVAAASPADERAVLTGGDVTELRAGGEVVGELRHRARDDAPPAALVRWLATLLALEGERARGPERASEAAVGSFLSDLLDRRVTDREDRVARGKEL